MRKKKEYIKDKVMFAIDILFLIGGVGFIALDFFFPSGDFIEDLILAVVGIFFLIAGLLFIVIGVTGGI